MSAAPAPRVQAWAEGISALVARGDAPSPQLIEDLVRREEVLLGRAGVVSEREVLESRLLGFGPLTAVLADRSVTDVLVNGDGSTWVDRGEGVVPVGLCLESGEARTLAVRLAGLAGRRLDDAQPWVDGLLPGGIRLHAVLPPLVHGGAHVSLRVPRVSPDGLDGLLALGMIDSRSSDLIRRIVEARLSFVVVGGTGAGKTTFMGGLLAACPAGDRLVVVEDVQELAPRHGHVVHLQGRSANVEGRGAVTMLELVRQALRMRPDRLIVGEVRGAEVRELLSALNTGHTGGGGTLHANSVTELPARLEALGALAGMSERMVATQVTGGVQVVFGMEREGAARRLGTIGVIVSDGRGGFEVHVAWERQTGRSGVDDIGSGILARMLGE